MIQDTKTYRMCIGIIAIGLSLSLFYAVRKQPKSQDNCNEFIETQEVAVISGPLQGAEGLVASTKLVNGLCMYKVRGQRGIETPFVEWFEQDELEAGKY